MHIHKFLIIILINNYIFHMIFFELNLRESVKYIIKIDTTMIIN